jgi:hypothetical protein
MQMEQAETGDKAQIDRLAEAFFGLFSADASGRVSLQAIHALCVERALMIKTCADLPQVMTLDEFVAPRETLLNDGRLADFREAEESANTTIFGNIAQRFCSYRKSGRQDGVPFVTRGMKTLQFVKVGGQWKISAVAWDDERPGLEVADAVRC